MSEVMHLCWVEGDPDDGTPPHYRPCPAELCEARHLPTHGSVAAVLRREKEAHPERFCPNPRCLWRTHGLHCPNHTLRGDEKSA